MTVKEVFELRKSGKIEEAYNEIRPMYAKHKGKYTMLAMFWVANDILKKRIEEKQTDEALMIFKALVRTARDIEDKDGSVCKALLHNTILLKDCSKAFRVIDFLKEYDIKEWHQSCWQTITTQKGHVMPSYAQQMLTRIYHEVRQEPSIENALTAMPLLEAAMRHNPNHKNNRRFMALVYIIMNEKEKAIEIYKNLLKRYRDSYLYDELSELTEDSGVKAALICQAIINQRQERFRTKYHLNLAKLLIGRDNNRAHYELNKCIEIRNKLNININSEIKKLLETLSHYTAVSEAEQQSFYKMMTEKYLKTI